jgi:hypothetical protein
MTFGAGGCFIAALVLTLVFSISNVNHVGGILRGIDQSAGRHMSEKPSTVNEPLKRGVEPAKVIRVPEPKTVIVPGGQTASPPPINPKKD